MERYLIVALKGEDFDFEDASQDLTVTIGRGLSDPAKPFTFILAEPPVLDEEYQQLLDTVESHTPLGRELRAGPGIMTVNGESSTEHIAIGIQLAEELIAMRGLLAATVTIEFDQSPESFILI